nr:mitochondrial cardiolipin hydrolase isoform X1 [Saimiri boliviensis boliviensis]
MKRLRWQVAAAAAVGLALALEVLPWVLRWLRSGRRRLRREVLFFPSQVTCTEALLRARGEAPAGEQAALPDCCLCGLPHGESSLSRLMRALLAARVSLELCLFAFSSPQLGRAVRLLHQRGVRVRVVTDCDYMALNGSQIGLLRKAVGDPRTASGDPDPAGREAGRQGCAGTSILKGSRERRPPAAEQTSGHQALGDLKMCSRRQHQDVRWFSQLHKEGEHISLWRGCLSHGVDRENRKCE